MPHAPPMPPVGVHPRAMRGDPLRKVVGRAMHRMDEIVDGVSPGGDLPVACEMLECGHRLMDFEAREPLRRRCRQCGTEPPRARPRRSQTVHGEVPARVPPRRATRADAERLLAELRRLERYCPVCGAEPGAPCVARRRGHLVEIAPAPHAARTD